MASVPGLDLMEGLDWNGKPRGLRRERVVPRRMKIGP